MGYFGDTELQGSGHTILGLHIGEYVEWGLMGAPMASPSLGLQVCSGCAWHYRFLSQPAGPVTVLRNSFGLTGSAVVAGLAQAYKSAEKQPNTTATLRVVVVVVVAA